MTTVLALPAAATAVMGTALAEGSVTDTVIGGPFLLAAGLALAAGVVSFASPCVLPLVPGYLSYLVGLVGAEGSEHTFAATGGSRAGAAVRSRAVRATSLFVLGFSLVFCLESVIVIGLSRFLVGNAEVLTRIGGVITVIVGLAMLGVIRPLQRDVRIHARPGGRILGAPLLGAVFALGWTACIGPVLMGVNSLAISSEWNGNAWRGLLLVVLYCAGLGIPFLLLAFGFGWASTAVGVLRRHTRTIQLVGALALIVIGLAMVTGLWTEFLSWLQPLYGDLETVL